MDPSHGPDMTLSIGTSAFNTAIHRDEAQMRRPADHGQSAWFAYRNCATGSKRKREKDETRRRTEMSVLSFDDGNDVMSPTLDLCRSTFSPCISGFSTGSGTSRGTMLMSDVTDDGPLIGLGLGLAGPDSHGADGCIEAEPIPELTISSDTGVHRLIQTNPKSGGNVIDVLLGLGPSQCHTISSSSRGSVLKGLNAVQDSQVEKDLGMQLQLSLSNSSTVVSDDDCVSFMSLGQGSGDTHPDFRNGNVCDELGIAVDDEGSTSGRTVKNTGYMPSLVLGRRDSVAPLERYKMLADDATPADQELCLRHDEMARKLDDCSENVNSSCGNVFDVAPPSNATKPTKICKFRGCSKGARGASGLCITHGGGRRCQRQGCNRGAEGRTVYCKSHGGGRRCQSLGCTKSAEGRTDYCIAHGGGRRCSRDGCTKAARGRSGLCIRHGGGKRCQREGCTKSAEGYSGLCISHGGGRRCQAPECNKGAQGSTMFCKAHGGGKRCMIQGCLKGAEGSTPLCKGHGGGKRCMFDGGGICTKSVHGGTSFCVAHGGGKRCAVEGCTKSARGRTSYCVKHGGGKRCRFENCTKSAQGSTDFCKAHGGGKRCSWGQEGSPYTEFVSDQTRELLTGACDRFARGKVGLCAAHSALVQDQRVHGAKTIGSALPAGIGPGLFRGLVNRLSNNAIYTVPASKDTGQESRQGSESCYGYRSEISAQSGFHQRGRKIGITGLPNNGVTFVDNESQHIAIIQEPCAGQNRGFTFEGIDRSIAQNQIHSQTTLTGGTTILKNRNMPAAYVLNNHKPDKTINMICGFLSSNYHTDEEPSTLRKAISSGERRVLLPPQVLVPLSMKKGQFLSSHERGTINHIEEGHARERNASKCEARVHGGREDRVHGGSILFSLPGKTAFDISRVQECAPPTEGCSN